MNPLTPAEEEPRTPDTMLLDSNTDKESSEAKGPDYTGPAVLSRGFTAARPIIPKQIRFRPFFSLNGIYDNGLTGTKLDKDGNVATQNSFGIEASFGISGRRLFKKDTIGIDYRGSLFHYTPSSSYDGSNHLLNLDYSHRVSPHLTLNFGESAGLYANNYALLNGTGTSDITVANTQFSVTPNTQAFDNRTLFLTTQVDAVYQRTARMSFNFGGSGFLVRRGSSALQGSNGYQGRGDVVYRFTRKTTMGPYYAFTHYGFTRSYGSTDVHTGGVNISHAVNRTLEFRLRAGVSRVEVLTLVPVVLDPVIIAILGPRQGPTGLQSIHNINLIPDFSAQITKSFRFTTASIDYSRGVTPGNGLYLTSSRQGLTGNVDYTGIRRYSFSAGAGTDTLSSLGQTLGQYKSTFGRAGASRSISRSIQSVGRVEYRKFSIDHSGFQRDQFRATVGITYSPGERPLSVW